MYDTFHEPFKRVVSNGPAVPESSAPNNAEPCQGSENKEEEKEKEDESKHKKKEPESTVKSALSAAFAKYADKVGKNKMSPGEEGKRRKK